jgi:putative ATPase
VWALAANPQTAAALEQQARNLENLERPVILTGTVGDLPQLIAKTMVEQAVSLSESAQTNSLLCGVIIGRNILTHLADKTGAAQTIFTLLKSGGRLVLAEIIPRRTQRLHQLVKLSELPAELASRVQAIEEAIYTNPADPMVNWDTTDLQAIFEAAGLIQIEITVETLTSELTVGADQIERWFALNSAGQRPTLAQYMLGNLPPATGTSIDARLNRDELAELKSLFERQLLGRVVTWPSSHAFLLAHKA